MAKNDIETKELKPQHYQAITALVVLGDVAEAARAASVSGRTLRRWMSEPVFMKELRHAEAELVRGSARRLGNLATKALSVLECVLDNPKSADNCRIRAATTVLDICLKWRVQVDFEERIKALEERTGAK